MRIGARGAVGGGGRAGWRGRGLASSDPMPEPYMWYQKLTEEAPPPRSVPEESRLAWSGGWVLCVGGW